MELSITRNWYMIYTKALSEKKIISSLTKKKIDYYMPVSRTSRQYRTKESTSPLLKSYLFVYATPTEHEYIRNISGVINFVYRLTSPVIIPYEEIKEMRSFLHAYSNVELNRTPVSASISTTLKVPVITLEESDYSIQLRLPSLGYILKAKVVEEYATSAPTRIKENIKEPILIAQLAS